MTKFEHSETFLAKWLSNTITKEELEAFKTSKDYELFSKIAKESEGFTRAHIDKNKVYENILKTIETPKTPKVRPLFTKWVGAIAASITLLFGLFYFMQSHTHVSSNFGEQLAITLPDNSEVILNSKSKLSYNKKKWKGERSLTLEGEAYFKVAKGSTFTVNTSEGNITVLGTQFNVFQDDDFLLVKCFEDTVKVESHDNVVILTQGKTFKYFKNATFDEDDDFEDTKPSWIDGESVFTSIPLKLVLKKLEKQYDITFKNTGIDDSKPFTGSFMHSDLQQALESVLLPMDIDYNISEDKKEIVLSKVLN